MGYSETSYCGLRNVEKDEKNIVPLPSKLQAYMHGYVDQNPTNCCNVWFCPAGTEKGYPKYSKFSGPEEGTYSYAAFLYGCTFNCLFCQNASHKRISKGKLVQADEIAEKIAKNETITCICYFGGTPEAQLPFTINLSELIIQKIEPAGKDRKFRICWEWNGSGNQGLVEKCMKIAIKTGGNIKFDLKAYDNRLHKALTGISNEQTLSNFRLLGEKYFGKRQGLAEISGCSLLVPGYINYEEVEKIAQFIANIDSEIPYSLLVFHPDYMMKDLPYTSKNEAFKCLDAAKKHLNYVRLGNEFLLQ